MSDDAILRRLMCDLGISVEAVAGRCGVDRSYASKQIRGERPMQGCVQATFLAAVDEAELARVTIKPPEMEIIRAGITVTRPSPMVNTE